MREGPPGQTGYRVRTRAESLPAGRLLAGAQLTSLIIGANVLIFVLMQLTGSPTSDRTLRRFGALINPLPASQWWRLMTAMFVHLGFLHILFNMLALFLFGGAIEQRYGKQRFLMLYLGAGVLGSATSLAYSHAAFSAGASGAIFGIIGAMLALAVWNRRAPGMSGQIRSLLFFIGINVFFGLEARGIDLRAHIGGLIGGFVLGSALEAPH